MTTIVKNGYESTEDMRRMQEEAIIRVREMQKKAKKSLEAGHQFESAVNVKNCETNNNEQSSNSSHIISSQKNSFSLSNILPKNNILDMFFKDSEKSLILILILLLVEENSDMGLILALMYLIM